MTTLAFKGNAQFIFLCNQKSSVNVSLIKIFKSAVTKKVIMSFNNLRKLLKVAVFVIFPKALFEIHRRFKGHFLKELHVSFNESTPQPLSSSTFSEKS